MKVLAFVLICMLSSGMVACERQRGVEAGNDRGTDTYIPKPATPPENSATDSQAAGATQNNREIRGELMSVNPRVNEIVIRTTNGMEQTLKVDDKTRVSGLQQNQGKPQSSNHVRSLSGKEGSEVVILWTEDPTTPVISIGLVERNPMNQKQTPVRPGGTR